LSNQLKQMFDFRLVFVTLLSIMILMPVLTYVHELGHVFACEVAGHEANFGVGLFGAWATCMGTMEDPTVFRYAGGFLASIVGFMVFVGIKSHLRGAWKGIGIALVAIAIVEYMGGIAEGYLHDFYMESNLFGAIQGMTLLTLVIFFVYRNSNRDIYKAEVYHCDSEEEE